MSNGAKAGIALAVAAAGGWAILRPRDRSEPAAAAPLPVETPRPRPVSHRLFDPPDRATFRSWFVFLAESMAVRETAELPRDVVDCAALARFAYREALRKHDGVWAAELGLSRVPPLGAVRQYNYPFTPTKAALFRIDEAGTYAEFADAKTLMRHNARRVSRSLRGAEPGDLLFYRQREGESPFHLMIYLGPGTLDGEPGPFVVYHTGPLDGGPGEIRRPSTAELLRHPEPRWRPIEGNPAFAGVYRWNILLPD